MKASKKKFIIILCMITIINCFFLFSIAYAQEEPEAPLPYVYDAINGDLNKIKSDNFLGIDLYTGSLSFVYPIIVPNGINNLQPKIELVYNSQGTEGRPEILGSGWILTQKIASRETPKRRRTSSVASCGRDGRSPSISTYTTAPPTMNLNRLLMNSPRPSAEKSRFRPFRGFRRAKSAFSGRRTNPPWSAATAREKTRAITRKGARVFAISTEAARMTVKGSLP